MKQQHVLSYIVVAVIALLMASCIDLPTVPTKGSRMLSMHLKWAMLWSGVPTNIVYATNINDVTYCNYNIADMETVFDSTQILDVTPPSDTWDCDDYSGEFIRWALRILPGGAVGSVEYVLKTGGDAHSMVIFFYRDKGDIYIAMVEPYIQWAGHLDRHGLTPIGNSGRIWEFDTTYIRVLEWDI